MAPITAPAWLERFAAEIVRQVRDDSIRPEDLRACAGDAMEDHRYSDLGPEEAAQLWARDFA